MNFSAIDVICPDIVLANSPLASPPALMPTASAGGENYEVLVFCSATVAANRITPPLQYDGIVEDYRATFAKAKTMRVDIPLAPHPEFFGLLQKADKAKADKTQNFFVDPGAFQPYIKRLEEAFETTLKQRTEAAN